MKTVTSITGREFRITSNKSKRTFTIRTFGSKYRTYPVGRVDFDSMSSMTGNDWSQFMRSNYYYPVK